MITYTLSYKTFQEVLYLAEKRGVIKQEYGELLCEYPEGELKDMEKRTLLDQIDEIDMEIEFRIANDKTYQ